MKQEKYNSTGEKSSIRKDIRHPTKTNNNNKVSKDKNNDDIIQFNNANAEIESIEEIIEYEMNSNSMNLSDRLNKSDRLNIYDIKTNYLRKII